MANQKIVAIAAIIIIIVLGMPAVYNAGYTNGYTNGYSNAVHDSDEFYQGYLTACHDYLNNGSVMRYDEVYGKVYGFDYVRGYNTFFEKIAYELKRYDGK